MICTYIFFLIYNFRYLYIYRERVVYYWVIVLFVNITVRTINIMKNSNIIIIIIITSSVIICAMLLFLTILNHDRYDCYPSSKKHVCLFFLILVLLLLLLLLRCREICLSQRSFPPRFLRRFGVETTDADSGATPHTLPWRNNEEHLVVSIVLAVPKMDGL